MWWLGLIQAGMGLYQMIRNQSEQAKLAKQGAPQYGLTPNMKSAIAQSEQQAKMGYMPQEKAAFMSNLSTSNNTAFRNAVDMSGGSMARSLKGALNAQNYNALNTFALNDAQLKRQNIANRNALYGQEQNLANQNTTMQNQLLLRRAQSLGQQGQSGWSNLLGGVGAMFSGGGSGMSGMFSKSGNVANPNVVTTATEPSMFGVPKSTMDSAVRYANYKNDLYDATMEGLENDPYYNYPYYNIGRGTIGGLYNR